MHLHKSAICLERASGFVARNDSGCIHLALTRQLNNITLYKPKSKSWKALPVEALVPCQIQVIADLVIILSSDVLVKAPAFATYIFLVHNCYCSNGGKECC